MMCIIAKQMVRTQHMGSYKHGWSQKLYMHVKGLIIMACDILIKNMRHQNKNHKHPYDHYVDAYALDLGHTY